MNSPRPSTTGTRGPRAFSLPWLVACAVSIAAFGAFVRVGPVPETMGRAQLFLGVASLAWIAALALVARGNPAAARGDTAILIVSAVVLRALALAGDPRLSDDANRYVWEGALVARGVSPYAHAPDAPERAVERELYGPLYGRINHPDVSAAYPPLAQAAFAGVVTLAGGAGEADGRRAEFALRAFFGLCDLAVLAVLLALLRREGRDPRWAIAWGGSPLVAAEFAGSGHYDVLALLLLLLGLLAARKRLAAGLLAAGGLVKLLPVVALPWILAGRSEAGEGGAAAGRGRSASPCSALLVFLSVLLLGGAWIVLLDGGARGLTRGLGEYGLRWESTNALYRFVEPLFPAHLARDRGATDPRLLGRGLFGGVFLAVALREWRRRSDATTATTRLVRTALLLSPTLHPWYVAWSVPWLALRPSGAWSLLVALVPLLYWPLARWHAEAVWVEPGWLWPAVFVPFFAAWAWERWRDRATFRP